MTPGDVGLMGKAKSSLSAARILAEHGFHDYACSRAYYAMFYAAEALLLSQGETYSKHAGVISAFGQRFAKTGILSQELHRFLIQAQQERNTADYEVEPSATAEIAARQIQRAGQFIAAAESALAPSGPATTSEPK